MLPGSTSMFVSLNPSGLRGTGCLPGNIDILPESKPD